MVVAVMGMVVLMVTVLRGVVVLVTMTVNNRAVVAFLIAVTAMVVVAGKYGGCLCETESYKIKPSLCYRT